MLAADFTSWGLGQREKTKLWTARSGGQWLLFSVVRAGGWQDCGLDIRAPAELVASWQILAVCTCFCFKGKHHP